MTTRAAKVVVNKKGEEVLRTTKRLIGSRYEGPLVCELTHDSIKLRKQRGRKEYEITAGALYVKLAVMYAEQERKEKARLKRFKQRGY